MNAHDHFKLLARYNAWATKRLLAVCESLRAEIWCFPDVSVVSSISSLFLAVD
jgi:uncharacterized damage-inducible protein DinB